MLHCAKCINLFVDICVHAHACLPHTHTFNTQQWDALCTNIVRHI